MYIVYVLISLKDRKLYIGFTTNLERRAKEHNDGLSLSTKDRAPFKLLYFKTYLTHTEAMRREKFLKGGQGRAQLKI